MDKQLIELYNILVMPESTPQPTVPDELTPYLDDNLVQAAYERWRATTTADMRRDMPEPISTEYGRAVILDPHEGERDEYSTIVVGAPYRQGWKPSMYIRMELARQAIFPNGRLIVLPNNSVGDPYLTLPEDQLDQVAAGNLRPFYEQQARVLEALDTQGEVILSGYSLGALTAVGLAVVASDKYKVALVNADEPPTGDRGTKELKHDFLKSGGWGDQRAAIADADIPVLTQALSVGRLGMDYARFGVTSIDTFSRGLMEGIAHQQFGDLLKAAREQWPDVSFKIGQIAGSRLVRVDQVPADLAILHEYTGAGAHKHATGDNPVAHALMILDAISVS